MKTTLMKKPPFLTFRDLKENTVQQTLEPNLGLKFTDDEIDDLFHILVKKPKMFTMKISGEEIRIVVG